MKRTRGGFEGVTVGYWSGQTGGCWWSFFEGQLSQQEWDRFLAFSEESYTRATPGDVILTIPYSAAPPNAAMRKQLGELVLRTRKHNPITHHAFTTDSKVTLLINTAISWIANKPYKEKTFDDPQRALNWLSEVCVRVSRKDVISAIAATVPAAQIWPRLR